jgi:hypothetical protein
MTQISLTPEPPKPGKPPGLHDTRGKFAKGHKQVGGRRKGTPNKRDAAVLERIEALGCDPIAVLAHFTNGDAAALGLEEVPPDLRLHAAKELVQYVASKRKPIDVAESDEDIANRSRLLAAQADLAELELRAAQRRAGEGDEDPAAGYWDPKSEVAAASPDA